MEEGCERERKQQRPQNIFLAKGLRRLACELNSLGLLLRHPPSNRDGLRLNGLGRNSNNNNNCMINKKHKL